MKWAQRLDDVFITIELPDAQDVKFKLEPEGKFFFSAESGADKIPYEVDLDLHDKVDIDVCRQLKSQFLGLTFNTYCLYSLIYVILIYACREARLVLEIEISVTL